MSTFQMIRLGIVSLVLAAVQVAGFDRFLLFGIAYLALPLLLAIYVGSRLPFTNSVIAGAFVGASWDLLAIDLFGRYALALGLAAGVSSLVLSRTQEMRLQQRLLRRLVAVLFSTVLLVVVSALAGEVLPAVRFSTIAGIVVSVVVGALATGRVMKKVALPGRTVWDPAEVRPAHWVDHRSGLYTVPAPTFEREAA